MKVKFIFYLQRFGGGGGTTVTEREPTPDEMRIIKAQAKTAEAYAPNAMWLNDTAADLLRDSYGTVQADFDFLNDQAQERINKSFAALENIVNQNSASANKANNNLEDYKNTLSDFMDYYNKQYENMLPSIKSDGQSAENALTKDMNALSDAYNTYRNSINAKNYSDSDLTRQGINPNSVTNTGQGGLVDLLNAYRTQSGEYANAANNAYNGDPTKSSTSLQGRGFIGANDEAYQTALKELGDLQNGIIPQTYQDNMSDAIRTAYKNTLGSNLNDLAQRGVLNSSVTNAAINDLQKNLTDTMAQNYLQNIGTLESLAQNKFQDAITASSETAGLANQQYQNNMNDLANRLNITNQITDLYGKNLDAANNSALQNANLATQRLNNATNTNQNLMNLYNQSQQNTSSSLNSLANWTQSQNANTQGANSTNANLYSNVGIGQATSPITAAAAAQEAAQQPALNLWNASIGLSGSNNGTLSALAGSSGKTTTTTSGGGFLSGFLGGLF